jgi:hypothetical protein
MSTQIGTNADKLYWKPVPSSLSWRIPLGIQIIPGIILAVGTAFLPPSPRLLVLHDRVDAAHASLALLRLSGANSDASSDDVGGEAAAGGDLLIQLELMEMRVETQLVQRVLERELALNSHNDIQTRQESPLALEWKTWKKLFGERYRDRTWIGVLIMVFQRESFYLSLSSFNFV